MKKVSKKISKITKVFLVFAIIFSNLTYLPMKKIMILNLR